jgi:hypothetical protein
MRTTTGSMIAASIALMFAGTMGAFAQHEQHGQTTGSSKAKMMEHCQDMMQQKQKMKEDMKAQDAQLTEHLARMNRAPASQKVDLMAAVLTHVVEQRIAMDARKEKMDEAMMKHMMEHMQMGKESMSECPMMKEMDAKSPGASEHERK